jgi:hypothetical protein
MLGATVDLRHFHVLYLLTLEIFGRWNIVSAFVIFHLLGQFGHTKEVIHSLERETFGLGNTVQIRQRICLIGED